MRREMVKQKLYAEHMMDDDDDADAYLQLRLAPASPEGRKGQQQQRPKRPELKRSKSNLQRMCEQSRRPTPPNYIDHSGSLAHRKPVRRAHSDSSGRPRPMRTASSRQMGGRTPPIPPKRSRSVQRLQSRGNSELTVPPPSPNCVASARFPPSPGPRMSRPPQKQVKQIVLSPSPRDSPRTYNQYDEVNFHDDAESDQSDDSDEGEDKDEDDDDLATEIPDDFPSAPPPPRRPPPRRNRRATVATQSLQQSADAAMRFGPPRKIKSYYPGANKPRNSNFHMNTMPVNKMPISKNESLDISDHSTSKGEKKGFRRGGLFRGFSGNSDDSGDTASSSERSSSFFRVVRRTNSKRSLKPSALKRNNKTSTPPLSTLTSHSDHSAGSHKSQSSWYTSSGNSRNSAPAELPTQQRRKNEIYNSAVQRAKDRQAMKHNRNHLNLTEQLSKLPASANDNDPAGYDLLLEDDDKESKSIFSSLISKIEDIYDDCS